MTPTVVVVMGVSGVGKTTIGMALARHLGWTFLEADDDHPPLPMVESQNGLVAGQGQAGPLLVIVPERRFRRGQIIGGQPHDAAGEGRRARRRLGPLAQQCRDPVERIALVPRDSLHDSRFGGCIGPPRVRPAVGQQDQAPLAPFQPRRHMQRRNPVPLDQRQDRTGHG